MAVKIIRNIPTSRKPSSSKLQKLVYSERWDLSHLAERPVERFEILLGEIESKVVQFESTRAQLSPTMETSAFQSFTKVL